MRRSGHSSRKYGTRRDWARNAGLRTDLSPVADLDVVDNPNLTGQRYLIANSSTPRDPRLGSNDRPLSDNYIVRDLHQIVYLGPSTDNCSTQRGPIHSRVGPDLHVVLYLYKPNLWDFDPLPPFSGITEPVSANHNARMKDDTIADATTLTHRDLRMEHTILSYLYPVSQKDEGKKHGPRPDSHLFPHIYVRENRHRIPEARCGIDRGTRADPAIVTWWRVKEMKDLRKGDVRLRDPQKASPWLHLRGRRYSRSDNDRACLAGRKKRTIVRVCEKGNISCARLFDGCNS
jgi:hypothetical protein